MPSSEPSTSERLQAARKRYEELKRKNKIPSKRAHLAGPNASESDDNTHQASDASLNGNDDTTKINDLQETIELQKKEIRKLRDENTELKLEHMETKDKVAELEKEIAELRMKSTEQNVITNDEPQSHPFLETEVVAAEVSESEKPIIPVNPPTANKGDFRESILAWKGWQVDMRDWSGSNGIQVVL